MQYLEVLMNAYLELCNNKWQIAEYLEALVTTNLELRK